MDFQSPKNILVVCKRTKYELALAEYPNIEDYKSICTIVNNSFPKVYSSHERQVESRSYLQTNVFPDAKFVFRKSLDEVPLHTFDLIVSLGGDNHFTFVGHYCLSNNNLILGCNSDTHTSMGALLYYDPHSLKTVIDNNWQNTTIEEWPLIIAEILYPNGNKTVTIGSISEVTVRNNNPDLISRYVIYYQGLVDEQKSSGVLLCTGAGSTGWYQSCKTNEEQIKPFSKTSNYFQVFSRELSKTARKKYKFTDFTVYDECTIVSDMDGGISIDSLPERNYPFPRGSIAKFTLSNQKLRVLAPISQ
jgi:NAD kinase